MENDPVASTTPSGPPAWGPRSACGSDPLLSAARLGQLPGSVCGTSKRARKLVCLDRRDSARGIYGKGSADSFIDRRRQLEQTLCGACEISVTTDVNVLDSI